MSTKTYKLHFTNTIRDFFCSTLDALHSMLPTRKIDTEAFKRTVQLVGDSPVFLRCEIINGSFFLEDALKLYLPAEISTSFKLPTDTKGICFASHVILIIPEDDEFFGTPYLKIENLIEINPISTIEKSSPFLESFEFAIFKRLTKSLIQEITKAICFFDFYRDTDKQYTFSSKSYSPSKIRSHPFKPKLIT